MARKLGQFHFLGVVDVLEFVELPVEAAVGEELLAGALLADFAVVEDGACCLKALNKNLSA